ncbi:GCN5-related N-acetyltransferase [Streptomyces venezuelae]|uniref:GNAT family N-acetyltransferase n=1 Tax=Streptomyces gardneri TaxID=66892 RepID=UPI0006BD3263|nr:GNAT family N-acetyltransferase [Streptomyces gardneri]ALO06335.1 GCN5-related N-acetyltransferase [Streptomyces venezuelae]QPK43786.1 GNAT family N-acetyltransferase [Streptomyces gardneri]WRK35042.1 GNAT family N-acetyltransferase [Streptomyces venezuelae]CUM43408.1 acetyltransferase, GNAT family [Streptomyces venezuelae]
MPASPTPAPTSTATPPAPLTTDRLLLRAVRRGDLAAVTRLWTDPEVRHHLGGPVTEPVIRIRQRRIVGAAGCHAVIRAEDDVFLGLVTVEPGARNGETEVSYQFLPEHWGKGYAREAVGAVVARVLEGTPSVVALTQEANHRSRRLLEAVGLEHAESFVEWDARQVLYRIRRG